MISGMAVFVVVAFVVGVVVLIVGLNASYDREQEFERAAGNLKRESLARKTKTVFFTYENEDGSLQWRRVSAR